jgi:hypothetical protein
MTNEKFTMTTATRDALIHCTVERRCQDCPLVDYGTTQLDCKTKLLEQLRDELLISKLTAEDKK